MGQGAAELVGIGLCQGHNLALEALHEVAQCLAVIALVILRGVQVAKANIGIGAVVIGDDDRVAVVYPGDGAYELGRGPVGDGRRFAARALAG